ncbi:MAG: nuclear transport factor 2 family protein [Saprospiraceae bacterium]|nr:nuclear transport factor 2 family protein [Saprospiraceae bacterium]
MKKILLLSAFCMLLGPLFSQQNAAASREIRSVMQEQQDAWNRGDLEEFMQGYWQSDSLRFIGSRGLTYGWQATLDNYKKGYPDRDAMGTLTFDILSVELLSKKSAFVVGKWHLARKAGDLSGHYTLLWRKIKGKWVIVADHSS